MQTENSDNSINSLSSLVVDIQTLQKAGKTEAVLSAAKQLLLNFPTNNNVKSWAAGFLIDSGGELRDLEAVTQGVKLLESLLAGPFSSQVNIRIALEYNLSNGYSSLFWIQYQRGEDDKAGEHLQRAKSLLQSLLLEKAQVKADLLPAIITNYANTLDHLGRTFEAIDQYLDCLQLYPAHAMAKANCAITIKRILNVSSPHGTKNLYAAWRLLQEACEAKDKILEYASQGAIDSFHSHLHELNLIIDERIKGGVEAWATHRKEVHGYPEAPAWLSLVNHDRLLLTTNIVPLDSVEECTDDLYFQSLFTKVDDSGTKKFSVLANSLNAVKEEYATARYLFYHVNEAQDVYAEKSRVTSYGNALDYAEFGIATGLLKASFRLAADCLDKVAGFINEYFELGHSSENVAFSNVWYTGLNPKKSLHPIIEVAAKSNYCLQALLDVKRDWYVQSLPVGRLKNIRNWATHNKLILYWMNSNNTNRGKDDIWGTDEFRTVTNFMLRLTKSAILYAVGTVSIEEQKRPEMAATDTFIPTIPFETEPGISDRQFPDFSL